MGPGPLGHDRAVPVLTGWLRVDEYQLKENALAALENLDSPLAAREVRPLLKSEAFLPYKLRMARLLARHRMADGYALATEHLADASQKAEAILVLAALDDAADFQRPVCDHCRPAGSAVACRGAYWAGGHRRRQCPAATA